MITLNAIEQRLSTFADLHFFVQSYGFGAPDEVDLDKFTAFPLMYVVYTGATYEEGQKVYAFEVYVFDRPTEQEQKSTNRREVVSDSEQCLEDLVADVTNGGNVFLFNERYFVESSSIQPIIDERSNLLSGALLDLSISVPWEASACNLPIDGVSPVGGEIAYARRGLLRMLTQDGTTDVRSVNTIKVTNGTLTDEGNGVVSLSISGGGGSGTVTSVNNVEPVDGNVTLTTDEVPEGITNLYHTAARVVTAVETEVIDNANFYTGGVGVISWNTDRGSLQVTLENGVTLLLGQDMPVLAKNTYASTIDKGTYVMFTGAVGNSGKVEVQPLIANGTLPGYVSFGITAQEIRTGEFGYILATGEISGIDTRGQNGETWTDGTILFADPARPGGLTLTQPAAPNLKLPVAAVVNAAANGILLIRNTTGASLSTLHDTQTITPDTGHLLRYNASNTRWENATPATVGPEIAAVLDSDDITEGSTNLYFTAAEQTKLAGIEDGAEVNVATNLTNTTTTTTVTVLSSTGNNTTLAASTVLAAGVMTSADRSKLDGIASGAEVNVNANWNATSGDAQILNKPIIPDELSQLAGTADDITEGQTNLFLTSSERTAIANIPPQFFQVVQDGATAITLDTGDEGTYIRCTASSAVTVTIPSGKFQADDEIIIEQGGTGQVTITAGAGVTLNNSAANTAKTAERYSVIGLKCVATDTFTLTGERELV